MRELGLGYYWNDLKIGEKWKTIGRTIFESDVVNFICVTGMQEVLFSNLQYIEDESPTGARIAPATLVLSIAEGLVMHATLQKTGLALLKMEFDIKAPVVIGDTIHVELEVLEARSTSKGDRGIVLTRNSVVNQRGETAMIYTPLRLMKSRANSR